MPVIAHCRAPACLNPIERTRQEFALDADAMIHNHDSTNSSRRRSSTFSALSSAEDLTALTDHRLLQPFGIDNEERDDGQPRPGV